jgi:hypothetical protein
MANPNGAGVFAEVFIRGEVIAHDRAAVATKHFYPASQVNQRPISVDVTGNLMEFALDNYPQNGVYLHLPDGRRIALTRDRIESYTRTFEANLPQLPEKVRQAAAFQACSICPERDRAHFCHALPATFAFVDDLQGFKSFQKVLVVYRGPEPTLAVAPNATMQEALQFVAIMSLMHHCEVGKKYWKYLLGIHPLQSPDELSARIYLNIYWESHGDQEVVERVLQRFQDDITILAQCQANRLRLVVDDDALVNAFASVQSQIACLTLRRGNQLSQAFEEYLARG